MSRANQLPNLDKLFKDDDDEQDFTPSGGSNLASLFGAPTKTTDLTASPKASKSITERTVEPSASNKTEVIIAKAVHAYKLLNRQYSLVGKLGIALTKNDTTKTYLLILYRNKQEHISVVTLTSDFSYSIRENNYATYYDGNNDNWSILFDSNDACADFAREICLSKYFIRQGTTQGGVMYQDLTTTADKNIAQEGDKIHLKYSIINNINQPCKMHLTSTRDMEVQITTDDNWERSLIGVSKTLKRLLILPPAKQISLGPGFPKDKDIALEIEVIDIISPEMPKPPNEPSSGKASLISRMAKMGQSILPTKIPASLTDSDDTEEEATQIKSPRLLKNVQTESVQKFFKNNVDNSAAVVQDTPSTVLVQKNIIPTTIASPAAVDGFPVTWMPSTVQQYISTPDGHFYPIQQTVTQSMPNNALSDANINVLLSENRIHNAEIRMGMSKIADNVQKLLDKFHILEIQNASLPNNDKSLETLKMLLALNGSKNEFSESQNSDPNESARVIGELKESVKRLENELRETKCLLMENTNKLQDSENEKMNFNIEKSSMQAEIEKLKVSLKQTQDELQQSLLELKSTNNLVEKQQKENEKLEIIINDQKQLLDNAATTVSAKSTSSKYDKVVEIKRIMNKTYQTLLEKFNEHSYTTDYIKATLASTIREITLQVVQESETQAQINHTSVNPKSSANLRINTQMMTGSHHQEEPPPIPPLDVEDIESGDWTS